MSDIAVLSFNVHIGIAIYTQNIYTHILMHIMYLHMFMDRHKLHIARNHTNSNGKYLWMNEKSPVLKIFKTECYGHLNSSSAARDIGEVLLNVSYWHAILVPDLCAQGLLVD